MPVTAIIQPFRGVAQSGSALALGARCREFKSLHPDQNKHWFEPSQVPLQDPRIRRVAGIRGLVAHQLRQECVTMVRRPDLTRIVLAVLLMGILISGSFWILRPFLLSTIWAAMIVVATWPMMLKLQARLGRRALAVAIMSSAMVLVFVAPLLLAIQTLVDNTDTITRWIRELATSPIPAPPELLARDALRGAKIAQYW